MTGRAKRQWKLYRKMVSDAKAEIESGPKKLMSSEQSLVSGEQCEDIKHLWLFLFLLFFGYLSILVLK